MLTKLVTTICKMFFLTHKKVWRYPTLKFTHFEDLDNLWKQLFLLAPHSALCSVHCSALLYTAVHRCPLLCTTVHWCASLCPTVHHCLPLCTAVHHSAPICTALQLCTLLYTAVHRCAPLCTAVHHFSLLCTSVLCCTLLCTAVKKLILCFNSYFRFRSEVMSKIIIKKNFENKYLSTFSGCPLLHAFS